MVFSYRDTPGICGEHRMNPTRNHLLFETIVFPHLGAAFNLACWLVKNRQDAEDIVQESCLRAFRSLDGYRGGNARAWLLSIVRNTGYTWLERHGMYRKTVSLEEDVAVEDAADAEDIVHSRIDNELVRKATENLPVEFREVIILRELEGFSYKEIAGMLNVPAGTVMSRLARARSRLQKDLGFLLSDGEKGTVQV